ncbi:MAG TPA: molybdopterin-dependent oxidoreductase [Chitinophagaceae bacterium]|nr:molybdopterin-dependent oxidoreductase [Chitinophagaceae bacterium]
MANFFKNIFTKNNKLSTDELIVKKTIVSLFFLFVFLGGVFIGWKWLRNQATSAEGAKPALRTVLNANENIFKHLLSDNHLAKEYPESEAVKNVRVNGKEGLKTALDSANWRLNVIRENGDTLKLTLDDIKKLPKTDIIFNFKCIEGWNQVTHWAGVKFSDFVKAYHLSDEAAMKYVGLSTPDKGYYVGIDMPSALHPQTILCYEMNGNPLPLDQGYPLRLIIPVKYGIKHLKRIGMMYFANKRPPDYWYERGYDYYSGL